MVLHIRLPMLRVGVVLDNEFDKDQRVLKEVALLKQSGYEVFVICFDFGKVYDIHEGISVTRISIPKKKKDALVFLSARTDFYEKMWTKELVPWLQKHQIQVLHTHDLYMSKCCKNAIDQSGLAIRFILDLHENYPAAIATYQWAVKSWRKWVAAPQIWKVKESDYLTYPDKIIVLSSYFKNQLLQKFPFLKSENIQTHPNLPNIEDFERYEQEGYTTDFTSDVPVLLYFGVVGHRRGIIQKIEALEKLLKEGLQFHLLIIGPVDKADKQDFEKALQLPFISKNVTYKPWSDVCYLPDYLRKTAVGLAPFLVNAQHDHGVANKLYQYMYGAVPILASACKAQQDLITDENCGLIYYDYEGFLLKVRELIEKPELRIQLGLNGKKALERLYHEKVDRQFLSFYKDFEK